MAMGAQGQEQARAAFSGLKRYRNSTGYLRGEPGSGHDLGWLSDQPHAVQLKQSLRSAGYVAYSFDTPIGWAVEDGDGNLGERVIPDVRHSTRTTHHQTLLRTAWSGLYHNGTPEDRARWLRHNKGSLEGIRRQIWIYKPYDDNDLILTRSRPRRPVGVRRDLKESFEAGFYWAVLGPQVVAWALECPEDPTTSEHIVLPVDGDLPADHVELLKLLRDAFPHYHDGSDKGRDEWLKGRGLASTVGRIGRGATNPFGARYDRV